MVIRKSVVERIVVSGGGGIPGGDPGQVQYNNAGTFDGFTVGGDGTLDTSTGILTVTSTSGTPFGTMATQNANSVTITGGTITGATYNGLTVSTTTGTLTITNGKTLTVSNSLTLAGTDGSTLNIGTGGTLGTMAYQNANNVAITGGSIEGTPIGSAGPVASGRFSTVTVTNSSAPGNGIYLPATNTLGIAARSLAAAQFTNATSAVNYFSFTGSATGNAIALAAAGSDSNITFNIGGKGTGGVAFTTQAYFPQATLTDGATINWDLNTQQAASVTLGGSRTFAAPTNMKAGSSYSLIIKQDGTGSRTATFNSVFKWPGGLAPTLTTTANATDIITFITDGTNMYGATLKAFA